MAVRDGSTPAVVAPATVSPPQPLVVVVGASAGGLEALLTLLPLLPRQGIAYVLAPHMANQGHGDLLLRLLERGTHLPIALAHDAQRLQPGQICLVPPGWDAVVERGRLFLVPPLPGHISTPSVHRLLASLAAGGGARVAALILSGAGGDGALACKALRAAGGLVLVQAPEEAKFDGMPIAALQALGPAAQGLTLVQMAQALTAWGSSLQAAVLEEFRAAHPSYVHPVLLDGRMGDDNAAHAGDMRQELARLLPLLQTVTGMDFSGYKEGTLLRGVAKRKLALGLGEGASYEDWLQTHPQEAWQLQRLFLVTVSAFFRDPESFEALERVLQSAWACVPPGQVLRVWVPACATGEEAYSLAMVLHRWLECSGRGQAGCTFTMVATDLNPQALAIARTGRYRLTALRDLPAAWRQRYFHVQGESCQVCSELQACVQWAEGNVFTQALPSQMDLVSCRNLLIYLQAQAQAQLLARFHASLRPHGLLFIGQAESLAWDGEALFSPVDYFHRIFVRKPPPVISWGQRIA